MKITNVYHILLLFLVTTGLLTSCSEGQFFYKNWEGIPQLQWARNNAIVNEVQVKEEDKTKKYTLLLGARHIENIPYKDVTLNLVIKSPSGKEVKNTYTLVLKNEKNEVLGEAMAEIVDLEQIVEKEFIFEETGTYTFTITQASASEILGGFMEVGLLLK